ncbi:MAG TPA: branched-chain-amino-acid transaminase [Elusimicrobiota bacterium]|nr:branched-chain-amino-acid transaminase [Elusimicrobiota bacterium]
MKTKASSSKTAPQKLIYLNGQLVPEKEAKISVFDHGLLYGDGVFEGIRAYKGRVFRLREHMQRLYHSARAITLDVKMPMEELEQKVLDTLRANKLRDAYVRLVVTRGTGDLGLDPRKCRKPTVFIIANEITLYPESCYKNGLEVITASTRRNSPQALSPNVKSLNYLNNILAKIEANLGGVPEAILLNLEGYIAECTGDNIFYIRGRNLYTPPIAAGALPGITRECVLKLGADLGLSPEEKLFTSYDLYVADEVFLTGTAAEVIPVVKLDSRVIGSGKPGPLTQKLIRAFRDLTSREGVPITPA